MSRPDFASNLRWLAATVVLALAAALTACLIAEQRMTAGLVAQARTDVRLRATLIDSELARFRLLPLALADDRDVFAAVERQGGADSRLDAKLERLARATGASVLYVIARDGIAVAASNWRSPSSFVGTDYNFRPYFTTARASGFATQFAMGIVSRRPGLYLARRTVNGGVVVVKLEFDRIERAWAQAGGVTLVRDPLGVVLVTSRPDWRFAATRSLTPDQAARIRTQTSLPAGAFRPLPLVAAEGRGLPHGPAGSYANASIPVAQPGWRLTLFRPVSQTLAAARRTAAMVAVASVLALSALLWAWRLRAALLRRQTRELERAVAEATAALRREMDERAAGEARAAELREGLRQANRLASLGQITASVAHETAQPVAAIRTYAQTSATLLARGATDAVVANLDAIGRLADRIGRITVELRGFSRRQTGPLRAVALADVLDGAQLILKEQLKRVTLHLPPIAPDLVVTGGRVRLEQVLVILLQNAVEALAGREEATIRIDLHADAEHVILCVADNGAGIDPTIAARLFTPFTTSRPAGLGLGLVIARDIMEELGGRLRLRSGTGGATFEMEMRRA